MSLLTLGVALSPSCSRLLQCRVRQMALAYGAGSYDQHDVNTRMTIDAVIFKLSGNEKIKSSVSCSSDSGWHPCISAFHTACSSQATKADDRWSGGGKGKGRNKGRGRGRES